MDTTNFPQASHLHKQSYLVFFIFTYLAKYFDILCIFPTMCGQEMVFAAFIKYSYELDMKKINHLYMIDFVKETTFIGSGGAILLSYEWNTFQVCAKM